MIVDTLQRLAQGGFRISDYQYTGFGSIYFVDFILFHRYLGLRRMWNVEHDDSIKKRVRFNSPAALIRHEFGPVSDVIPLLSERIKHLVWLDFDERINENMTADVCAAGAQLSPGSILLVTVDVEPPGDRGSPAEWKTYFEERVDLDIDPSWGLERFTQSELPRLNALVLGNAIRSGLNGRVGVRYFPLFSFLYRDGNEMLTIGGVIGGEQEEQMLRKCPLDSLSFLRRDLEELPYRISVPRLTRKERLHLDSFMPCRAGWRPRAFELKREEVEAYRDIYRFYPSYAELLLG